MNIKNLSQKKKNVGKFKELQLYESVGLIEPVGEEHMYFAAMNSKSCRLTPLRFTLLEIIKR